MEWGDVTDQTGALGTNGWGKTINGFGAFVIEVLLTALFVLVVLLVTGRATAPGFAGLAIGLALATVHFVGINLTGTSVNPARSIGPALFAGAEALKQLWLFIVAPLVGAGLAAAVWPLVRADEDIDLERAESVEAVAQAADPPQPFRTRPENRGADAGRVRPRSQAVGASSPLRRMTSRYQRALSLGRRAWVR